MIKVSLERTHRKNTINTDQYWLESSKSIDFAGFLNLVILMVFICSKKV
jgi:hypothetical protein